MVSIVVKTYGKSRGSVSVSRTKPVYNSLKRLFLPRLNILTGFSRNYQKVLSLKLIIFYFVFVNIILRRD